MIFYFSKELSCILFEDWCKISATKMPEIQKPFKLGRGGERRGTKSWFLGVECKLGALIPNMFTFRLVEWPSVLHLLFIFDKMAAILLKPFKL